MTDFLDFEYDIITELNISKMRYSTISKNKLRIDVPTIFLTIPDTNVRLQNTIYDSGMLLSNCEGIISPNKIYTLGNKKFNGRHHFLNLRKSLLNPEVKGSRRLKIVSDIPIPHDTHKATPVKTPARFWFYDMSIHTKYYSYALDKFSEKLATQKLFDEVSKAFHEVKTTKKFKCELLFLIKNDKGHLLNTFKKFKIYMPSKSFETQTLYDNFGLVSNCNNTVIPLLYKDGGRNKFAMQNITKLYKYIDSPSDEDIIEEPSNNKDTTNIFDKIIKDINVKHLSADIDQSGNVKPNIDNRQLSKLLQKYKISDPDVVANVKQAVDKYVGTKKKDSNKDELEIAILKAINYSVHGKEELDEEYIHSPQKLIRKVIDVNTHKTPLEFPKFDELINPTDIIDLTHTTGVWRQKHEFEDTIHENVRKLFTSIENVTNYPIKVKKIDHEVIDDDQTRYINYKITLTNINGGDKGNYDVELKVPSPVNDRYFKIRGTNYVMSTQQFFKPITKTDKNEVRIISNYAIAHVAVKNLKFNVSDIKEILHYMNVRYRHLIKDLTNEYCIFNEGDKIYLTGSQVYKNKSFEVFMNENTGKLQDSQDNEIQYGKNEYIYELLLQKIQTANPEDKLTKTKKSIPFIQFYMGGIKIPLIIYLWHLKGLLTTLNDLGIDYEVTDNPHESYISIPTKDDAYLAINPKSIREKLIINGLMVFKIQQPIQNLDDPEEIHPLIDKTYGQKAVFNLRLLTQNEIDPVTKELLEFENLPTDLPKLVAGPCIDKLLNDTVDSVADLKIYRSRMSEMVLQSMYEQLKMAHNRYTEKITFNEKNQKIALDPNYIINDMITEIGVLQFAEPVNPVDEITYAAKVIKTGKGGIPSKRAFKPEHRNIHESQIGSISAHTTPESSTVGLITHHTMTPLITNIYGSYGIRDPKTVTPWQALSINEALVPFQNQLDSDRLVMAATHAKQVTPTDGNEPPLICTGAEYIVPQISSKRFVHTAKKDGEVIDINTNKTMTVKYKDGTEEVLDILPRMSRTKMGAYVSLDMQPLEIGDKFKKNEIIASTKNFSGRDGMYCSGKNVFMAVMNYNGYSHEDAYVISNQMANSMNRDLVKEVQVIIPPDTKILRLTRNLKTVDSNEVLVEFTYDQDIEEYLEANELLDSLDNNEEVISTFSQSDNTIKLLSNEGEIVDIKVYINNKNSIDKQIVNFHKELVKDVQTTVKQLESNAADKNERIKAIDNLNLNFIKTGGHKLKGGTEFLGARIVYYIKQKEPLSDGDKLSGRYGNKGVIGKVLTEEETPKPEHSPRIDVFISPVGIFSRKNVAMLKELYLGKILYFLKERIETMANDTTIDTKKIQQLLLKIYEIISDEKIYEKIKQNINNINPNTLRKNIISGKFKIFYTISPFTDVSFDDIQRAADELDIPLDEKVYIPENGTWTKSPVPVGVSYFQALEQTAEIYTNVRSAGRYQGLTRQATSGKSREGGQSIGNLDVFALNTYNAESILKELLTLRSDDHKAKREVINNIINNGNSGLPSNVGGGGTSTLMRTFMLSMGLYVH